MARKAIIILAIVVAISLFSNYILYQQIQSLNQIVEVYKKQNSEMADDLVKNKIDENRSSTELSINRNTASTPKENMLSESTQSITAVAVRPILLRDSFFENVRYEGTAMKITVDIRDGKGLVLVNTETPTGVDFQTSAKTAVKIAQEYTNVDLSDKDIIFSIASNKNEELQAVDGPSAGGAMTVLLISEIQGKTINDKVLVTGTIESDGTIGRVGGIAEKADVAGKNGAKIFLVPQGQAITQVQTCQESKNGVFIYRSCTLEEKPLSPIMKEKYGMNVVEVNDIKAVLDYFT
ncbi:MAG: hypothetical protein HZA82_05750 [Thaumarchaeota archaeon]|nr:hypothetical protein [Nitrososphaerota archaeon]